MEIAGRYELGEKIGAGGMGTVYVGHDHQTGQTVAIKQLKPEVVEGDPAQLQRFVREGELLRQLNHPNIVKMLDYVEQKNAYYLIMEYVAGGSLLDLMQNAHGLTIQRALYIALDIADALTRAHRLKILHRDIKPANILLAADGTPLLTDFGMARGATSDVTQEGMVLGTLAYLSPEALHGDDLDERSDIWSFGVLFYEMLTGERPFGSQASVAALITAILTAPMNDLESRRPDLPMAVIDLVYRMLAREREARIPSVRMVGTELEAVIRGRTTSMQAVVTPDDSTGRFATDDYTPSPDTPTVRPVVHLPAQATLFIGRDAELAALDDLLHVESTRLVTLLGPGGVGKTRLAVATAERNQSAFPDGVYFTPLTEITSTDYIVPTVAESMGFVFSGTGSQQQQLGHFLEDKRALLVLDNFDYLAEGGAIIADLLKAAPHIKIIITSRERLRIQAEQVFEVNSLNVPDEDTPLEALMSYHAVRLFLQSAHRVQPGFEILPENATDLTRVLALVQGLPLGIELAAAWLEALPLDEIVQEMEQSIDFLETDLRDVPERHRSIRAVFNYSWNMLGDSERDAFMKLSVFKGGFEREAAQKVTGANLRTLTTLTNKSLIRRDPTGRYHMHRLSAQYAAEKFAQTCVEQKAVHTAHAGYYADLLRQLEPSLNTRREQDAMQTVDTELENIRATLRWGVQNQEWDKLNNLMAVLGEYYRLRGLFREGVTWFEELATSGREAASCSQAFYWQARLYQALLMVYLGEHEQAYRYINDALDNLKHSTDYLMLGLAWVGRSRINILRGEYEKALEDSQQAVDVLQKSAESAKYVPGALVIAAQVAYLRGQYRESYKIYEELLGQYGDSDYSPTDLAQVHNDVGLTLQMLGEFQAAAQMYKEAYDIYKSYRHKPGMAESLNHLAGLMYGKGDYEEAQANYQAAYRLNREVGNRVALGHSLSALGNLAIYRMDTEVAWDYFQQSLAIRQKSGDVHGIADSLLDLATVKLMDGDYEEAGNYTLQAETIYREIGDEDGLGQVMVGRGLLELFNNNLEAALGYLEAGQVAAEQTGSQFLRLQAIGGLGEVALRQGRLDEAEGLFMDGLQMLRGLNIEPVMTAYLIGIAAITVHRGQVMNAAVLICVLQRYPVSYIMQTRNTLDELWENVCADLTPAQIAQAQAEGKTLTLQAVMKDSRFLRMLRHDKAD